MRTTILLIGLLFFMVSAYFPLSGLATGQDTKNTVKEDYGLQERCGRQADELFKREYKNSGVINTQYGKAVVAYRNHYNKKLNKCFLLITNRDMPRKDTGLNTSIGKLLYDVNEHNEYGSYFKVDSDSMPLACKASGKDCHSKQEWDSLIKPYMEE